MPTKIPPDFGPGAAYAAGVALGRRIRAMNTFEDLNRCVEESVTKPYGNYVQYRAIKEGFIHGYVGWQPPTNENLKE
jgi:hypothetical protein